LSEVFSHSRLGCFEKCPRQFHYRYVERRPAPFESVEAFLGKRVHEILERLYRFVGDGRVPPLAAVLRRFQQRWDERFDAARVRIARAEEDASGYRATGERCLARFYRRHYPFDADETLGIEEHVSFSLDGGGAYRVRGIIDRLVRARDGALEIHDYKTARRTPSQRVLDEDRQLALYELGVRERHPDAREIRLVWHYLQSGELRSSTRTPEQLDQLRGETMQLIDRIETETAFEPRPSPLCAWCEYSDVCPASAARPRDAAPPPARAPARPPAPEALPARGQLSLLREPTC
jgi:putative RecB family exonuclease